MLKCREMAVAGKFYPASKFTLQKEFNKFLSGYASPVKSDSLVRALIIPHAGYSFSGQTAIRTIASALHKRYKRIVVLAPSHYVRFNGIALPDYEIAKTPFGDIEICLSEIEKIDNPFFSYIKEAHECEHSLEVELPIIKYFFDSIPILPFVCGSLNNESIKQISEELLKFWNDDTLWIISSDFTHYGRNFGYLPFKENVKENIKKLDYGAIEQILATNLNEFSSYLQKTSATICGANPIKILLSVINNSADISKIKTNLIEYTTSGEMTNDYSHCVSYAGIVFVF